jgi:hypothetical protein
VAGPQEHVLVAPCVERMAAMERGCAHRRLRLGDASVQAGKVADIPCVHPKVPARPVATADGLAFGALDRQSAPPFDSQSFISFTCSLQLKMWPATSADAAILASSGGVVAISSTNVCRSSP